MEGSESPDGSTNNSNNRNSYLGVNKLHSGKISKVVKRSVIQAPKHQAPVYTIDKNDFRNIVQRLTGSPSEPTPAAASPSPPPPPPPPASPAPPPPTNPAPPRLQRVRPPPLQSVFSFNKLVSNPNLTSMNSVSFPSHYHYQQQQRVVATTAPSFATASSVPRPMPMPAFQFPASSGPSPQFYSPLPPIAPSSTAWANAAPAGPRPAVPRMTVPSGFAAPFQLPLHNSTAGAAAMAQQQATFLGTAAAPPLSPLFLSSSQQQQHQFPYVSPLPSPGSQFALSQLLGGSQVPFSPGSFLPLSPTTAQSQLQFAQLLPPSPGSFLPLSPTAHYPFTSF